MDMNTQLQTPSVEKEYLVGLQTLKELADSIPNTRMLAAAKVLTMATLNMRWEKTMVDRNLSTHPWLLVKHYIEDACVQLSSWKEVSFIEGSDSGLRPVTKQMEDNHHDLFQALWVNFTEEDYTDRINRYTKRLELNDLAGGFLEGKRCVDFGCGHGNFAHALLKAGADSVDGIDYGEESIRYSLAARDRLGITEDRLQFRVGSVYDTKEVSNSFDFAIQNGVFHHLEDEGRAYREVYRVLKPGGWFWIYTDGAEGVGHNLWDASVHILRDVPHEFILQCLDFLNVETNKRYHLGDGLNAVYRHTTWEKLTQRLTAMGFGHFRRLVGGFSTDFDHDVIEADPYGTAKFGSGDLRLLTQKL